MCPWPVPQVFIISMVEPCIERDIAKRHEARHVGEGLAFGVRDLGMGIYGGVTGVVVCYIFL